MLFSDVVSDFLSHIKHGLNLTENTIRVYRSWLGVFVRWADEEKVPRELELRFTLPVIRQFLYSRSKNGLKARTIHNIHSPLRALASFCVENRLLPDDPTATIKLPKKEAPHRPLATDQELSLLLAATERQSSPRLIARDRAMLSVLIYTGVRFQELLDIRVQDVSLDAKTILIASGKGRKPRTLYPNVACLSAISEWLRERAKMRVKYDWLWAYDPARRMGETGTRQMLDETKARAGLADRDNIQFHAIRRAYATRCLAKGLDLRSLSASLGHSSPSTTLIYTFASERPAEAMKHYADLRLEEAKPEVEAVAPSLNTPTSARPTRADQLLRQRRRFAAPR